MKRFRREGAETLAPGRRALILDFSYDGFGLGKGGTGVLKVDETELVSKQIPHTVPMIIYFDDTFDIGIDIHTGVDDGDYHVPFISTARSKS